MYWRIVTLFYLVLLLLAKVDKEGQKIRGLNSFEYFDNSPSFSSKFYSIYDIFRFFSGLFFLYFIKQLTDKQIIPTMIVKFIESKKRAKRHSRRRKLETFIVGPIPCTSTTVSLTSKIYKYPTFRNMVKTLKKTTFRDEAIISMSIAGEVTDSSIVEMGKSRPQFQYSREELMVIKNLPMAKRRPECLDAFQKNARPPWESERWHSDRKRSETPPEDDHQQQQQQRPLSIRDRDQQQQQNDPQNKRRSGDPRERIRKEQDGIVLSPQRRSFNTGCFVNVTQPITRRPESPIGKTEVPHREPVRRIGSGRLLTRDMWDFRPETDKIDSERPDYSAYRSSNNSTREINREPMRERDNIRDRDDRYERRSFGRDFGNDRENRDRNNDNRHPMDRDKDRRDRRYGGGGGGSNERRRNYEPKEPEEPEWFSGGPISQHDTIELRGFDDIPEEKTPPKNNLNNNNNSNNSNNNNNMKKTSPAQKKRGKKIINERDDKINDGNSAGPKGRSTPTSSFDQNNSQTHESHSPIDDKNDETSANGAVHTDLDDTLNNESNDTNDKSDVTKNRDDQQQQQPQMNFNLDDFLKSDNLPGVSGLLANGVGAGSGSSSRFSQWFKRESPIDQDGLSINDELLNNLLNDITEPNIQVPSVTESNTYFAPISPANQTGNNTQPGNGTKLLEMLQRGSKPNQNGQDNHPDASMPMMKNNIKDMEVGGKMMHSLEELEARMRGGMTQASQIEPPRVNKNDDEMLAFKKLLAQVSGGQAVPAAVQSKPAQPMTLMQLLKSQQAQQHIHAPLQHQQPPPQHEQQPPPHQQQFNHHGPLGPAQHPHQAQMQHENLMKVLRIQQQQQQQQQQREQLQQKQRQQQNDMLSMMIAGQRMTGASPIPPELHMLANNVPSSRELLQRPEAQAIIQGLQQGEITIQHLIQQLQNPAMQPRHREVLGNILKTYGPTTPRTVSPHQGPGVPHEQMMQQLLFQQQQQQQQQQRVPSPMNNVMPHRVPSPRDLVMHTQSIMQNALIKTKLEEQRENYRKRQEQQQQQQQHHHHHHQQQQMHQQRITSPMNNSPSKQMMSPTPLTFTPTSVLRKMTAEKEPDGSPDAAKIAAQNQATQMQQMQTAVQYIAQGLSRQQQGTIRPQPSQPQPNWASQPAGRPIVKGVASNQFQFGGAQNYPSHQLPQDARIPQHHHPMSMSMGRQSGPGTNGGSLSPTSNQLARWFSPELLAKARAGKLPELGQTNMLSLEELERLQQTSAVEGLDIAAVLFG